MFEIRVKNYMGRDGWITVIETNNQDFAEDQLYHYLVRYHAYRVNWNWNSTLDILWEV